MIDPDDGRTGLLAPTERPKQRKPDKTATKESSDQLFLLREILKSPPIQGGGTGSNPVGGAIVHFADNAKYLCMMRSPLP